MHVGVWGPFLPPKDWGRCVEKRISCLSPWRSRAPKQEARSKNHIEEGCQIKRSRVRHIPPGGGAVTMPQGVRSPIFFLVDPNDFLTEKDCCRKFVDLGPPNPPDWVSRFLGAGEGGLWGGGGASKFLRR